MVGPRACWRSLNGHRNPSSAGCCRKVAFGWWPLEDKRYGQDVLIPKWRHGDPLPPAGGGGALTEPPALFGQPGGVVMLGEVDDPGMEVEIAVRKYGVPHEFSEACLAQAKALPTRCARSISAGASISRIFHSSPSTARDARDFDDAVYCRPVKVGRGKGWRLLVAIADVSHMWKPAVTSISTPTTAPPACISAARDSMLPEKSSNGLCSLNPHVERLCMVCDMMVSARGEVQAYQFLSAVMLSHARLTYKFWPCWEYAWPEAAKYQDRGQSAEPATAIAPC